MHSRRMRINPFDPNAKVFITFFIELKKYVLSTPQRRNIKINLFDVKSIRKEGWKSDHLPPPQALSEGSPGRERSIRYAVFSI